MQNQEEATDLKKVARSRRPPHEDKTSLKENQPRLPVNKVKLVNGEYIVHSCVSFALCMGWVYYMETNHCFHYTIIN